MKRLSNIIRIGMVMGLFTASTAHANVNQSAYDFSFTALTTGEQVPLKQYQGKVLLIVNTASKCGFTPQYAGLQALYETYKDEGLVVIGVPSNDFGAQEPGSAEEIHGFCQKNYGVTFPMMSKEVVSGEGAHPFYLYAKDVLGFGTAPKWNFHKYLVDKSGKVVDHFNSTTAPDADSIKKAIEKLLHEEQ
jgi:glutathione peroxidase